MRKLYVAAVLAAAVMGVATSTVAGPDCDAPAMNNHCDEILADDSAACSFLAQHDPQFGEECLNNARAKHEVCKNGAGCG